MKEFFEKQLDAILSGDESTLAYPSAVLEEKLKAFPPHLFKYRDCKKEYNFAMIEDEYLWADIPANFYDPYDSLVNLKLRSELPNIQKWLYSHLGEIIYYCIPPKGMQPHKWGQTLQVYVDAQQRFSDATGRYSAKKARKIMVAETRKLNPINQREIQKVYDSFESAEFEQKMQEAVQNILLKIVNALRDKNLVCCLTQRKDNQKMWEEYADKYAGFVIEYDLSAALQKSDVEKVLARTFPVSYYKRMPTVPLLPFIEQSFYRDLYNRNVDVLDASKKLLKQLLIKKYEYSNEEEWRILSSEQKILFPAISAIYMGYKINDADASRLLQICGRKKIPIYKQQFNPFTATMEFIQIT